jgi:phage regulator Rha-like protein
MTDLVPMESITGKILLLRGMKVMLDRDLAELYGVPTKALKQAVRRNSERFPDDFMFELSQEELANWRSQFVTSKSDKMGLRYPPLAFTEQGVAMLSTVLNSKRAIQVNIQIMRAFTSLRQMLATHEDLRRKIEDMESKYDEQFRVVFEALRQLLATEEQPERKIGFVRENGAGFGDAAPVEPGR